MGVDKLKSITCKYLNIGCGGENYDKHDNVIISSYTYLKNFGNSILEKFSTKIVDIDKYIT